MILGSIGRKALICGVEMFAERNTTFSHVIGRDRRHCICRDFTVNVIALCFEQHCYSTIDLFRGERSGSMVKLSKLCRYFINKPKWLTGCQLSWSEINTQTRTTKNQFFSSYVKAAVKTSLYHDYSFMWSKVQRARDARAKIAFFAFVMEDSRIEPKSSQRQTRQLPRMRL